MASWNPFYDRNSSTNPSCVRHQDKEKECAILPQEHSKTSHYFIVPKRRKNDPGLTPKSARLPCQNANLPRAYFTHIGGGCGGLGWGSEIGGSRCAAACLQYLLKIAGAPRCSQAERRELLALILRSVKCKVLIFWRSDLLAHMLCTVRVKIITGSLVTLENLFPENYRYRYRLEIRMNYHNRYRLGPRSRSFISIDSQLPSRKSFELIFQN